MSERRQRPDGTWTYASEAWDAKWYWPVGTRVRVVESRPTRRHPQGIDETGTVVKENSVSVRVRFDSGREDIGLIYKTSDAQERGEGLIRL